MLSLWLNRKKKNFMERVFVIKSFVKQTWVLRKRWVKQRRRQQQKLSLNTRRGESQAIWIKQKHISAIMINCNEAEINVVKNEMETKADVFALCVWVRRVYCLWAVSKHK